MKPKTQELINKINAIKDDYDQESQKDLEKLREDLEMADAMSELSERFEIQDFIKRLNKRISLIQIELVNKRSESLPDSKRDNLLDRKDLYEEFIQYFDIKAKHQSAERFLKSI